MSKLHPPHWLIYHSLRAFAKEPALDLLSLSELPPADDSKQNGDDRNHQKEVNEPAHGVRRHKAQEPEDDENNRDCIEHCELPFLVYTDTRII